MIFIPRISKAMFLFSCRYYAVKLSSNNRNFGKPILKVLHSGVNGAEPCLILSANEELFFFNFPEGTYRALLDGGGSDRIRKAVLKDYRGFHIVCTANAWRNIGGLPNLFLSGGWHEVKFAQSRKLFLHGPKGIGTFRHIILPFFEEVNTKITDISKKFQSPNFCISPVPLDPKTCAYKVTIREYGASFLVVECRSEEILESLICNEKLKENQFKLIVHLTPESIFRNQTYKNWMLSFKNCRHLVLNETAPNLPHLPTVFKCQLLHYKLDPQLFPLLSWHRAKSKIQSLTGPVVYAEPGMLCTFDSGVEFSRNATALPKLDLKREQTKMAHSYPQITMLGTSSTLPNIYRNVAGILVHLSPTSLMLLDCGEGTLQQMAILYGSELDVMLRCLQAVFISHTHTDHWLGLISLISRRREAFLRAGLPIQPLHLLIQKSLSDPLSTYNSQIGTLTPYENAAAGSDYHDTGALLGLKYLSGVKVDHPKRARGIVFVDSTRHKIVYTGDTSPCKELLHSGRDADLLIHDATFDDSFKDRAHTTQHSTVTQAIEEGIKMNARMTLLTHFSLRYGWTPPWSEKLKPKGKATIAYDFMHFDFDNLERLAQMPFRRKEFIYRNK